MPWSRFEETHVTVGHTEYFVTRGGEGAPVLLLHGFPEPHLCWSGVAPALARRHRVVAPDLRGYGASRAPRGGLMAALGHDRFAVVGHDRGARVGYRMALDHPDRVTAAPLLDIVPALDQFDAMGADGPALGYWPWYLLAQPAPFPERLIGVAPGVMLDHVFATWPSDPAAVDAEHRAGFRLDRGHDADDRGHQLDDAPRVRAAWADDLTTTRLPGGHLVPEESPDALVAALDGFLARTTS